MFETVLGELRMWATAVRPFGDFFLQNCRNIVVSKKRLRKGIISRSRNSRELLRLLCERIIANSQTFFTTNKIVK